MQDDKQTGAPSGPGIFGISGAVVCALFLFCGLARASEETDPVGQTATSAVPVTTIDLFARPVIAGQVRAALARAEAGDVVNAAREFDRLIAEHPTLGDLQGIRAALAVLEGDPDKALNLLENAAALAMLDLGDLLADPVFAPLAKDAVYGPRLTTLLAAYPTRAPRQPVPAPVLEGHTAVTADSTVWNPASERLEVAVAAPDDTTAPVLPDGPKVAAQDILRDLYEDGRASGNFGDLYDNRDRGHSALKPGAHPQLTHITYSKAARAAGVDYGLNEQILFDRPTLGNSSTALVTPVWWRSQPRHALTNPDGTGPMRLWQNVQANHLYIYPAHKDFTEENGDLFPANTPYILVSRGSSGSDRSFMEAVAMIMAAFRPDTKTRLVEENMLVSTVQMVFRRSLQNVRSRETYFSGTAHPAVFSGREINLARMVSLANSITAEAIPPETRIRVESEDQAVEGVDFFGDGLSEQLFDTPQAAARIWRSKTPRRSMILSAGESRDANDRPLTFHWRLLQGDPERVTIEPLGNGRRARVTLDWHDPFPISDDTPLTTARVDIGVFANNGVHDGAPAMLSWYFPPHETRLFEPGPDGTRRIASIDYADPQKADVYADPLLFPRMDWRDAYHYEADGTLTGWTRHRDDAAEEYTAEGQRILSGSGKNKPPDAVPVSHSVRTAADGTLFVVEISNRRGSP